jgi:hypothetical protein
MKKIMSIFVALLLLFNTVGMLVFYWGEMERCEALAENRIVHHEFNEGALIEFSSANKDFQLIENKEVLSNGILYDIVKIENRHGILTYFCFSDKKESGFWNGISQLGKGSSEHSTAPVKDNAPEVLKYIGQDKTVDYSYIYIENFSQSGFMENNSFYTNPYSEISAPPPKV